MEDTPSEDETISDDDGKRMRLGHIWRTMSLSEFVLIILFVITSPLLLLAAQYYF